MAALIATLLERGHAYRTDDGSIFFRIASWPAYGTLARARPDASSASASGSRRTSTARTTSATSRSGRAPKPGEPSWSTPGRRGPTRLAHRVLRDEHALPRAELRHPHRRHRPRVPAPRGRDRPVGGGHGPAVRAHLAPLRPPPDGRREDGQAHRQLRATRRPLRAGRSARGRCATRCSRPTTARRSSSATSRWPPRRRGGAAVDGAGRARRLPRGAADDPGARRRLLERARAAFEAALDDDLNIAPALAAVFDLVRELNRRIAERTAVHRGRRAGRRRAARPRPGARRDGAGRAPRATLPSARGAALLDERAAHARRGTGRAPMRCGTSWPRWASWSRTPGRPALAADGGDRWPDA